MNGSPASPTSRVVHSWPGLLINPCHIPAWWAFGTVRGLATADSTGRRARDKAPRQPIALPG
jgi:hypothetical protein